MKYKKIIWILNVVSLLNKQNIINNWFHAWIWNGLFQWKGFADVKQWRAFEPLFMKDARNLVYFSYWVKFNIRWNSFLTICCWRLFWEILILWVLKSIKIRSIILSSFNYFVEKLKNLNSKQKIMYLFCSK